MELRITLRSFLPQNPKLLLFISLTAFACSNAAMKLLTATYSPLQTASLRGLAALPFVFIFIGARQQWKATLKANFRFQLSRALLASASIVLYVYAMTTVDLMQLYSIAFLSPIFVCLLAIAFRMEKARFNVWLSTLVAFCGTLFIFRPQLDGLFSLAAASSVLATLFYACMILLTKVTARNDGTDITFFWHNVVIALVTVPLASVQWIPIKLHDWLSLFIVGLGVGCGQYLLILAYRGGSAANIIYIEYLSLPVAFLLDFLFWKNIADINTLLGCAIIVSATLLLNKKSGQSS